MMMMYLQDVFFNTVSLCDWVSGLQPFEEPAFFNEKKGQHTPE